MSRGSRQRVNNTVHGVFQDLLISERPKVTGGLTCPDSHGYRNLTETGGRVLPFHALTLQEVRLNSDLEKRNPRAKKSNISSVTWKAQLRVSDRIIWSNLGVIDERSATAAVIHHGYYKGTCASWAMNKWNMSLDEEILLNIVVCTFQLKWLWMRTKKWRIL